jgi:hypothetical protein
VLPSSRSVQVGNTLTAFTTIINTGSSGVSGCAIVPVTTVPASFIYQTTNPCDQCADWLAEYTGVDRSRRFAELCHRVHPQRSIRPDNCNAGLRLRWSKCGAEQHRSQHLVAVGVHDTGPRYCGAGGDGAERRSSGESGATSLTGRIPDHPSCRALAVATLVRCRSSTRRSRTSLIAPAARASALRKCNAWAKQGPTLRDYRCELPGGKRPFGPDPMRV